MSFLKTLFWIVAAVIAALFCFNNWTVVDVNLWNGLILETKLPLLLAVFFLLGLIPPLLLWQATRYRLRRRMMSEPGLAAAPSPLTTEPLPPGPITTMPPGGA
jgi:membrane protein YdbS with pleckstrin-like domain